MVRFQLTTGNRNVNHLLQAFEYCGGEWRIHHPLIKATYEISQSKETNCNTYNDTDDFKFLMLMLPILTSTFTGTYFAKEVKF